jgi:hydroxymethylglutaryl-CoA lyase
LSEVSPRDGFQNEAKIVATEAKIELIDRLGLSKLPVIECTSFFHPKMNPQFADHRLIGPGIIRNPDTKYLVFKMCMFICIL